METISLCSLNVRGLGNFKKRQQVFQWLNDKKYSICLLQETHSTPEIIDKWKSEWKGETFFSGNKTNRAGVAILFNQSFSGKIVQYNEFITGRLVSVDVTINDRDISIFNIYGSNEDNTSIFCRTESEILKQDDKNVILGGDFNTVMTIDLDKKNGRTDTHQNCRAKLIELVGSCNLVDAWRKINPSKLQYTWHSNTKPCIFSRLDYFLISENLINLIHKCKIKPGYKTDHSVVEISIDFMKVKRGPGYFKMNNSLLYEEDYQKLIKESINDIAEINKDSNPNTLWELIKGTIRNQTIKYASHKKKLEQKNEEKLIKEIEILETKMAQTTENFEDIKEVLDSKKTELENIYDSRINGMLIRCKAINIDGNEKNSKFFANLEKKNAEKKNIFKLKAGNTEITDQIEILKAEKVFYEKLYTKQNETVSNYDFFDQPKYKLKENEKLSCEGLLTEHECLEALKK